MTEQESFNIQSDKYAQLIERTITVVIEGVPLSVRYAFDKADNDLIGLRIFTGDSEEVDIHDIVWKHYEKEIDDAIMEDVKK